MNGFFFSASCPSCGAALELTAAGNPLTRGSELRNVLACCGCSTAWLMVMTLTRAFKADHMPRAPHMELRSFKEPDDPSLVHGRSGYVRGCKCQVCVEAERAYQRSRVRVKARAS